jgi:streptogramin lyase/cytochrome c5
LRPGKQKNNKTTVREKLRSVAPTNTIARGAAGSDHPNRWRIAVLKSGKRMLCLGALAFVASVAWAGAGSAQEAGTLTGVIKDAAGAPVAGAFVQMKNADRRLNFMVVTHDGGKYATSRLPAGKYVVQAIGGEQESAPSAPVEVAAGKSASVDLDLTVARAPALAPAWPGRTPGDRGEEADAARAGVHLPDGDGKAIIEAKCNFCHDSQRIVRSRGAPARWQQVIATMKAYAQGSTLATPITDDEEKVLLTYVSSNFGPAPGGPKPKPDPLSRLPRTLLPPEARDYMVVEYELPNPRAEPHEMAVDARGNGWVSQRVGGKLGRFDPETLNYVEYAPPAAGSSTVRLNGIRRGNSGELWMVDGGPNRRWLSFDPKTEQFLVYNLPPTTTGSATGNTVRVHPNGTVWLASIAANQVIRLDPATQQFTFFDVPAGVKNHKNATPYGMAVDGAGNVWVVENAVDQIARIDPKTGQFEEFPLPVKDPVARKLGADWDGNLWVGLHGAGKLLKIDYKTLRMTEFVPPSQDAGVYLADPDMKNHVLWTTLHHVDKIARLDPATGVWTEFPLMSAETDVRRLEIDPNNTKRIWYSGVLSSRVGFIEMLQ